MKTLLIVLSLSLLTTSFGQTITYTLKSTKDSSAISGLKVDLVDANETSKIIASKTTGPTGEVVFDSVPKGVYALICDPKDWTTLPRYVSVKNKKPQTFLGYIDPSGSRRLENLGSFYLTESQFIDTLKAYGSRSNLLTPELTIEQINPLKIQVASTLKYSSYCVENGMQGKVYVKLLLDETNTILHATIERSPDVELSAAAIDVFYKLKKLPFPESETKGHYIFIFPVTFKLT